jgi:hypothetical protein
MLLAILTHGHGDDRGSERRGRDESVLNAVPASTYPTTEVSSVRKWLVFLHIHWLAGRWPRQNVGGLAGTLIVGSRA